MLSKITAAYFHSANEAWRSGPWHSRHPVYREESKKGNLSYIVVLLLKRRLRHRTLRSKYNRCQSHTVALKTQWSKKHIRKQVLVVMPLLVWVDFSRGLLEFQGRTYSSAHSPVTNSWYSTSVESSGGPDVTWCPLWSSCSSQIPHIGKATVFVKLLNGLAQVLGNRCFAAVFNSIFNEYCHDNH